MPEIEKTDIGKVKKTQISAEVKSSYLDYAMSVIVSRALPDVRDGLKPVHRRILYAMDQVNLSHRASFSKSAKVVGEVLGKYHPHGDSPVYEAMVRLAQEFSMRYPLVEGQGNFGSIDGDRPAAMRYTEARLAKISQEMLKNLDKETVPFVDNFDGSLQEPEYLPAVLPNLLIMGAEGIAVGMATKIPPHNLTEACRAVKATLENGRLEYEEQTPVEKLTEEKQEKFIDHLLEIAPGAVATELPEFESDITLDQLLEHIKGPDFPTAGAIYSREDIKDAYANGRGKVIVRGKADIEEMSHGKWRIVIYELPYQVNKADLVAKIAKLVREDKLTGISDLRDESDRHGIRVVVELKRNSRPQSVLNNLFKKTRLGTSFPFNMVTLVDNVPQTLGLKPIVTYFVQHRQEVITREAIFNLKEAKHRAHILEGLKIALDNMDEIIATIKKSADTPTAREKLMKDFGLSEIQANAILNMQLKRLSQMEREKIEEEYEEIMAHIEKLSSLILHPKNVLEKIETEMDYLIENYGDKRRTEVFPQRPDELAEEDLIANKKVIVSITKHGYIKRIPRSSYRSQRRGGKGVTGMTTKEEDYVDQLMSAQTHDRIIFFTDQGKAFATRVWQIPEGSRRAKGKPIINLIDIEPDEKIKTALLIRKSLDRQENFLLLTTKNGLVKKTALAEFDNIRSNGLIAINLKKGDELLDAKITQPDYHILLVTKKGQSIRFNQSEVRATARDTIGVKGIDRKKDDKVVTMATFPTEQAEPEDKRRKFFRHLLVVTANGLGKRTDLANFPLQHRNGKGVKAAKINEKTGPVADAQLINHNDKAIIITSKKAKVIRLPIRNIPVLKRNTQGVILMRFKNKKDKVASFTVLKKTD